MARIVFHREVTPQCKSTIPRKQHEKARRSVCGAAHSADRGSFFSEARTAAALVLCSNGPCWFKQSWRRASPKMSGRADG
jgi:hypothetical protein